MAPNLSLGHSDKDAFGNKPTDRPTVPVPASGQVVDAEVTERETQESDYAPTFRC